MSQTTQSPSIQTDHHRARTHTCGELRGDHIGDEVILKGWVDTRRNLGGLVFVDLRDRYGLTQVVFEPHENKVAYEGATQLRAEFVVSVKGRVAKREQVNPEMPTGSVEVRGEDLIVLNASEPLPFSVSVHEDKHSGAHEDLRLKYRYLDLRRPELQRHLRLRHDFYQTTHRFFDERDFLEIETPVLMKSTPEGARDFLVPSRLYAGKFYALPQSPQTYKQLCMFAALDRYVQIVKCFRDEDLRADRQPEFTQIDVEMAFADEEQVYSLTEGLMASLWSDLKDVELQTPFPRMTYDEALRRYGTDKPDLRIDMEIEDVSSIFDGCGVRFLQSVLDDEGGIVAMRVKGEGDRGRNAMDRLDKYARSLGAGGLGYFKVASDGSGIQSWLNESVLDPSYWTEAVEAAGTEKGDLVLVLAGEAPDVFSQMGGLRLHLADELDLIPNEEAWRFLWVTDFPLVQWNDDEERYTAMHHPFTSPLLDDIERLGQAPEEARSRAYDLVLNGNEIGGGSIRIHDRAMQQRMFELLGISEEEAQRRFGFLLDAFRYGAPPHGGIALGLDRMVMLLSGAKSLREVIAFPKTQSAQEPMVSSPDVVDARQLRDLHLEVVKRKTKS